MMGKFLLTRPGLPKASNTSRSNFDVASTLARSAPLLMFGIKEGSLQCVRPEGAWEYKMKTFGHFTGTNLDSARMDLLEKVENQLTTVIGTLHGDSLVALLIESLAQSTLVQFSQILDWLLE